jgi:hypothetical protein
MDSAHGSGIEKGSYRMSNFNNVIELPRSNEPTIVIAPNPAFGNDPDSHRWRARWNRDFDNVIVGIRLEAFPVIRKTEFGVWVDPFAWWYHNKWEFSTEGAKWMSNTSAASWAKPYQKDALHSLTVRYQRWSSHVRKDIEDIIRAGWCARKLLPSDASGIEGTERAFLYHLHDMVQKMEDLKS